MAYAPSVAGDISALVERGQAALAACDWATARSCFEQAAEIDETAEVVDGLGQALYWQGDYPQALALRERAYALYHRRGDRRWAALVAIQLAGLHGLIYGNAAAVSGWIAHAQRMLEDCGDCPERGWLELFLGCITDDPGERERRARDAMEVGRRFGQPALEFDALGYVGKALVERGLIEQGMQLIDEAVAATTSGVVTDPWAAGEIYCTLFDACEMTVDVRRAEGWLGAVDNYVERTGELPISGICRMHYGGLLTAAGRWDDAERELLTAIRIYEGTYRGTLFYPLLRLADLRVRQGRLEEAQQLLSGYEELADAVQPRARLHLARGEGELAETIIERHLAQRGRGVLSAPILALLVEAKLAGGRVEEARSVAVELADLAASSRQTPVHGLAALSQARVAVAAGQETAVELFERALTAFAEAELLCEAAHTRLELATLLATVKPEVARAEARAALVCFQQLEASRDADAAANLLRKLGEMGRPSPKGLGPLTKRESEVLR
ncbi:MAG: hypothetical protein M3O70_04400, partial [Actinomycetota bacterium]|nr:hypothetical protein [Actinomycetota bacterium]